MKRKPVIAFLGTDGSGKTTVMNAVLPLLEACSGGRFIVHHLKPDLLPPLGRLRGVRHEAGYVCRDPHGSKPSGYVGSLIRLGYLTADYILGYWFKVRTALREADVCGWVFDRYAYDMLIDPLRFRIQLPPRIIRCALCLIPKPDVVICLGGDPSKIYVRKPETSIDEVARQMELLKRLCASDVRMHWVDTTGTLDVTVGCVRDIFEGANRG